jgi:hypothetical protein
MKQADDISPILKKKAKKYYIYLTEAPNLKLQQRARKITVCLRDHKKRTRKRTLSVVKKMFI